MKYIITESQIKFLIKKFFKKDFSEKIQMIQYWDDLPSIFKRYVDKKFFNVYLNKYGPMYVILVDGKEFLLQYRGDTWSISNDKDVPITENELIDKLGIAPLGISIQEFIDAYVNYPLI